MEDGLHELALLGNLPHRAATPYDLIPLFVLGLAFFAARRLDRSPGHETLGDAGGFDLATAFQRGKTPDRRFRCYRGLP